MHGIETINRLNAEAGITADTRIYNPTDAGEVSARRIADIARATDPARLILLAAISQNRENLLADLARINNIVTGKRYFDYDTQTRVVGD